jgi:uncharacterized repeat protein (TIGR01451 family)
MPIRPVILVGRRNPCSTCYCQEFLPNPLQLGETATLTFTITNPNDIALQGVAFDDAFPSGLTVASLRMSTSAKEQSAARQILSPLLEARLPPAALVRSR